MSFQSGSSRVWSWFVINFICGDKASRKGEPYDLHVIFLHTDFLFIIACIGHQGGPMSAFQNLLINPILFQIHHVNKQQLA